MKESHVSATPEERIDMSAVADERLRIDLGTLFTTGG